MQKTTEQKLVLNAPDGSKITRVKISDDGKSVEIIFATEVNIENLDEIFPIIDIRELIGHPILTHNPITWNQKRVMEMIRKCIELELPAFRVPCMDPSEENGKILFEYGNMPAIGHLVYWYEQKFKEYMPPKNSRMGNRMERAAFLGIIIKYLVERKKYNLEDAWKEVCDDSLHLGHYLDYNNPKMDYEPTACRKVGYFYDLANVTKIIKDEYGYYLVGGGISHTSDLAPMAREIELISPMINQYNGSVGWMVMDP